MEHDTGYAPEKWAFDDEVTRVFDDMLQRSIPQYEVMRQACFDIACRFVKPKTDIVDLGCARGEAMAPLIARFGAYNRFVGVEVSEPMRRVCEERFKGYRECGVVQILDTDLCQDYPPCRASLTLAILTLVFTPINYRQRIIQGVYDSTTSGGALILVEKILGESAPLDGLMVDLYHEMKARNGYSKDEIDRKRLALEGVQVPVTARWNEEMLKVAGFRQVDCFWRWMNFAGWVAVK